MLTYTQVHFHVDVFKFESYFCHCISCADMRLKHAESLVILKIKICPFHCSEKHKCQYRGLVSYVYNSQ